MTRRPLLCSALASAALIAASLPALAESAPSPQSAQVPPATEATVTTVAPGQPVPLPKLTTTPAVQQSPMKRGCNYNTTS